VLHFYGPKLTFFQANFLIFGAFAKNLLICLKTLYLTTKKTDSRLSVFNCCPDYIKKFVYNQFFVRKKLLFTLKKF